MRVEFYGCYEGKLIIIIAEKLHNCFHACSSRWEEKRRQ